MKTFILSIFLVVSQIVFTQNTLKGIVTDKTTNEKLVGASVFVPELNKGTFTDKNGNYIIKGFHKGSFNIHVSYLGHRTKIEKINMDEDVITRNIQLEPAAVSVNEVVVSGAFTTSQDKSPQEINVIKKSEMQNEGASTVMDVISNVPGVSAITTGPLVSRPVIRGLSGNRILTVVDGVCFETQQWDEEHGIGINELGINRIEIIKGPASLLYGPEAMGGVVNFVESKPAPVGHISGNFQGSIFSNNLGFLGSAGVKGATEKYNWSLSALGKSLPDYYYKGYNFRAPNTRLNEIGFRGTFGINPSWGSSSISYQFNQAFYGILDGKDISANPDGSITIKDTAETEMFPRETEAPYHAVTDHKLTSKTSLVIGTSQFQFNLGYQNNHRTEYEDNGTKAGYDYVDMTLQSYTYDLKWFLPTWGNFSAIIGTQGMYQLNKNSLAAKTNLIPDATINDIGFVGLIKLNSDNLNFIGGVRYDSRNLSTEIAVKGSTVNMPSIFRTYSNVSGSIGATYNIKNHILLRGNFATGYRTPNLNELMANGVKLESQHYEIGNTNFVKEQNNEIDLKAIFNSKHFSVELAVYLNSIKNYIYLTPTGDSVKSNLANRTTVPEYKFFQNNALIKGGEASIHIYPFNVRWMNLDFKASTLTATRSDNNSYLPLMPADKIAASLNFKFSKMANLKNVFLKIGTVTAFDQNKVAHNELKTSGYTLLNLSFGATKNIWKLNNIDFVFAVKNALDRVYMDNMSRLRNFGVPNPGLDMVFSMKVPFDMIKN